MHIQKIHIENFRLLKNVDIVLDKSLTLIVGKNNTGKTSIAHLIRTIINEKKNLSFNDYPLESRKVLYELLEEYWDGTVQDTEIKSRIHETKLTFYIDYSDVGDDQFLGELRNFIIDMDDTQNTAQIDAVYAFNSLKLDELFGECRKRYDDLLTAKEDEESSQQEISNLHPYDRSIIAI